MKLRWYDRTGRPITQQQVEILEADPRYKTVAFHEEGEHHVTTIWLGGDQPFFPPTDNGLPTVFETIIFGPEGSVYSQKYAGEVSALAGHDQAVMRLRCEILPEATR